MREFLYPRKGFWRGFGYIGKRMRRLPDTPHRIALGFACGAFASFSPFFTLHFFVAAFFAWLLRGNIVAALFGTIVGNPLSFPAIASSSLWLGRLVMGREGGGANFEAIMEAFGAAFESAWAGVKGWFGFETENTASILSFLDEVFLPYLVGGAMIGVVAAFVSYWILGPLVAAYQTGRQRRIERRAAERRQAIDEELSAYETHDRTGDNA
ncbi:DUF2062 domain-containing protein [Paralimibaculum aggregatum]|uniref:DUF2062 domain-containing protein n=1 Tax=Paralimibaculum aggregatum TaxID=3036245 RepID=A0ABQ6LH13_9RHOB|nr:DUF2062 domain-containing protein [Limibaculum sp. NKW23]GMG80962.1 DUF2062 domain-containing protein [Limibaculum sp. NKW23]